MVRVTLSASRRFESGNRCRYSLVFPRLRREWARKKTDKINDILCEKGTETTPRVCDCEWRGSTTEKRIIKANFHHSEFDSMPFVSTCCSKRRAVCHVVTHRNVMMKGSESRAKTKWMNECARARIEMTRSGGRKEAARSWLPFAFNRSAAFQWQLNKHQRISAFGRQTDARQCDLGEFSRKSERESSTRRTNKNYDETKKRKWKRNDEENVTRPLKIVGKSFLLLGGKKWEEEMSVQLNKMYGAEDEDFYFELKLNRNIIFPFSSLLALFCHSPDSLTCSWDEKRRRAFLMLSFLRESISVSFIAQLLHSICVQKNKIFTFQWISCCAILLHLHLRWWISMAVMKHTNVIMFLRQLSRCLCVEWIENGKARAAMSGCWHEEETIARYFCWKLSTRRFGLSEFRVISIVDKWMTAPNE